MSTTATQRSTVPPLQLLDNALLVAQARRRLRPKQLYPALLITALLCISGLLLILVAKEGPKAEGFGIFAKVLVGYIALMLYIRGTLYVAAAVGEERRSGLLDFHRATPTTALTDAAGYLLGCPAREYATAALAVPFLAIATACSDVPIYNLFLLLPLMVLSGWLYHAIALSVGLSVQGKRGTSGTAIAVVIFLLIFGQSMIKAGLVTLAYLTPIPMIARLFFLDTTHLGGQVSFYGFSLHPVVFTILVQGSLLGFLLFSSVRRLAREGSIALSRPSAFLLFAWLLFLLAGGSWHFVTGVASSESQAAEMLARPATVLSVYLLGATGVSSILVWVLAPSYLEFVRALRRARRQGSSQADWLWDGASVWPLIGVFGGLILAGFFMLVFAMGSRMEVRSLFGMPVLLGLASQIAFLAFVASATEYTRLHMRNAGRSVGVLILFLTMVLPWIVTGIAGAAGMDKDAVLYIGALSPGYTACGSVVGLAAELGSGDKLPGATVMLSLASTTAIAAYFLFRNHSLLHGLIEKIPLTAPSRR